MAAHSYLVLSLIYQQSGKSTREKEVVKKMPSKYKEKNFASFNYKEAFKQLNLTDLLPSSIEVEPIKAMFSSYANKI